MDFGRRAGGARWAPRPRKGSDLHAAVFAGVGVGVWDPNDGVVLVVRVFQVIGAACRRKLMSQEVT